MTPGQSRVESRSALWAVLALAVLASVLVWPTMLQLFDKWRPIADNVLGHAWPVIAVAGWGLARDSRSLPLQLPWRLQWLPALCTIMLGLAWAFAFHAALGAAQQVIWPFLVGGVLWIAFGTPAMRNLSRAIWLLLFVVPIWAVFHGFLWKTTTVAVHTLLELIGLPAEFEGNVISLPSGRVQIAAGCAGLGFFTAAVSCGAIIGYLNRASWRAQIVLIGVAALVAMVCNWIRIVIIVFEADRTAMQTPLIAQSHYTFGWIVFSIGLVAYCLMFGRYGLRVVSTASYAAPKLLFRPLPALAALGCAALGPGAVALSRPADRTVVAALDLPAYAPWRRVTAMELVGWQPVYLGADHSVLYQSTAAGEPLLLYANLYLSQSNAKKLIGNDNSVLPESGWQTFSTRRQDGVLELIARDSFNASWLVRQTYVAGHSATPNARMSQLSFAWQQFWSDPTAGTVALAVRCRAGCREESERLDRAWAEAAVPLVLQIQAAGI